MLAARKEKNEGSWISEVGAVQKFAKLVDLEEMLQNERLLVKKSASKQPRKSLPKFLKIRGS